MTSTRTLVAALAMIVAFATVGQAAEIFFLSTTQGSLNNGTGVTERFDTATVIINEASGVSGPSAADLISDGADGDGIVGLNRLWNNSADGYFSIDNVGGSATSVSNFDNAFLAITITADAGQTLNLTELSLDSAAFTSNNRRGYEIYAEVDGGTFDPGDLLIDVNDENASRANPANHSADLTGAKYQGISSITFKFFPLTDLSGRTVDFKNFTVEGEVIPEPASLALLGLGGLMMLKRRRA